MIGEYADAIVGSVREGLVVLDEGTGSSLSCCRTGSAKQ